MARAVLISVLALGLLGAAASAESHGIPPPQPLGHGRIGLQVAPMTPELREGMKAPRDAGVLVVRVEESSAAAQAGVRVGDIVTRAGGEAVSTPRDLIRRVGRVPEGGQLALELVRNGETVKIEVAPRGAVFPGYPETDWLRGESQHRMDALERRLEELERRLEELEQRVPTPKPT
jgi:membrane-associated protease RseP (regulator of RpoE activity)